MRPRGRPTGRPGSGLREMVKQIVVEVEVVDGKAADEAPPGLVAQRPSSATVSKGLSSEDTVGAGLTAVLERAASSSALVPKAQRKGASPALTAAPARTRTPGSSGSGRRGKADGSKKSSPLSSKSSPLSPRPAKPSLAGLESACGAAMASLAAGQAAPADASGTASKLVEQLAALQSTLAMARAEEGGLSELDEPGFDEDDSDDDEPEADMDEAEENEYVAGGGGTGTDGHLTSGDDTASLRRSGRSGTSATTSGAPADEGEGEGSEGEGGAAARERPEGRQRRERPSSSFIPLDTMSGIEITEPDMMFDSKPLLDPTLARRLDPMGCFPTCGGGEKRARSGKPDAALVIELNDPACEPLTFVYCLSNGLLPAADSFLLPPHSLLLTPRSSLLATCYPGWSTASSASGTTT